MQVRAQAKGFAVNFKAAILTFWRGFLGVLKVSRLPHALAYGLAAIFIMVPIKLVGDALNWALARESGWLAYPVVVVATALMILFAAVMTNEQFLRDLRLQGMRWPSLLSIALAWLSVVVFGALSCTFERLGISEIYPSVPVTEGCATHYADLYLWHLFDSIPGIKFNETIGWAQQYWFFDAPSGWLLLAFKVLVIVAVIGSFVVCGRLRREGTATVDAD